MKRKLVTILALALSLALLLAGCSSYGQKALPGGPAASDPVTSNGGLIVRKGDYYYYINGKAASASDNNVWKKTVKGALMRCKVEDLYNADKHDTVIPKLLFSGNATEGGFSIYGDYIYYTSPNDQKDKTGAIQSSYMDFFRTKLNGTDTTRLATISSNTAPYRYYYDESANKVYLVYVMDSKVYRMDCDGGKPEAVVEEYTGSPVFAADGRSIYYTAALYYDVTTGEDVTAEQKKEYEDKDDPKKDNIQTRKYNKVMRYDVFDGKEAAEPLYRNEKYTVSLSKVDDGYLYYSLTEVAGGSGEKLLRRTAKNAAISDASDAVISRYNTSLSGYITAPNGDGVLVQATNTINWQYDFNGEVKYKAFSNVTGSTLLNVTEEGGSWYLYYFTSDGVLSKLRLPSFEEVRAENFNWTEVEPEEVMKDIRRDKDTPVDKMDTGWIKPEYLDGKWFFFNSASNSFDANTKDKDRKNDDATMYYRNGYLYVYDTQAAGDSLFPVRIGELTEADAKDEKERLEDENKSRKEKREAAAGKDA